MQLITTQQIQAIVDQHPKLHIWGNGTPHRPRATNKTIQRHHLDFDAAREEITHPSRVQAITEAADWCRHRLKPSSMTKRGNSSYHWKHVMEKETGAYIPSGAFAVAAILAGLPVVFDSYNPTIQCREIRT